MAILLSTNVNSILNVTANIANTGNLLVTQNTYTGNLSITALANTVTLNVSQNAAIGNIAVTQNVSVGNISFTGNMISITGTSYMNVDTGLIQANATNLVLQTLASSNQNVVLSANGTANLTLSNTGNVTLSSGNLITTYNIAVGNIAVTQNISTGNISVSGNVIIPNGPVFMNIDTGLIQTNTGNMVIQTLISSNANVVLSANGTANATLSNTGNLTLSSGNLITTYNVVAGNVLVTTNVSAPQIQTYNGATLVLPVANISYQGTSTVNVVAVANGTNQVNVSFAVNTTAVGSSATSPGGANQQLQFNNNGTIAGSANLVLDLQSNTLILSTNANVTNLLVNVVSAGNSTGPSLTQPNQVILYSKNVANIPMLFAGSGRANTSKQDMTAPVDRALAYRTIGWVTPNVGGIVNTTAFVAGGSLASTMNCVALTVYCNVANGIPTNTTIITSSRRFQMGANANLTTGNATIFANSNVGWAGGVTTGNGGGYIFVQRFSLDLYPPNTRFFVGVTNAIVSMVSAATDVDPLSNNQWTSFGFGSNGNTSAVAGNVFLTYGIGAGTRTNIDLGNQYTLVGNTGLYEVTINCPPGGATMGWTIKNLANGASNTGVVTVTANLPALNAFMQPVAYLKSNAAAISNMSIMRMYMEQDF